jgi:hypothetical protein
LNKIDGLKTQNKALADSSVRYSESGSNDQTNLGDISGSASQDMQRISHLKAQEQENIELKEQIQVVDEKFKEVLKNFNAKISKKNKRIRDLSQQIKDLQESFQILSKSVKEANLGKSQTLTTNQTNHENYKIKVFDTQKGQSNDGSVIYTKKERYITPDKGKDDFCPERRRLDFDSVTQTKCTPFDRCTTRESNSLTPNQLYGSVYKSQNCRNVQTQEEEGTLNSDCLNCNDMFLKSTIYKLEATETTNSYLAMQKKFVKKALTSLTDEL